MTGIEKNDSCTCNIFPRGYGGFLYKGISVLPKQADRHILLAHALGNNYLGNRKYSYPTFYATDIFGYFADRRFYLLLVANDYLQRKVGR